MDGLLFVWDDGKNAANRSKHGVGFEEAKTVFVDDFARLIQDPDHSDNEERFILLGMSSTLRILVVCHCEQNTNTIRIISARKAGTAEHITVSRLSSCVNHMIFLTR